jgi:hypothetical protein
MSIFTSNKSCNSHKYRYVDNLSQIGQFCKELDLTVNVAKSKTILWEWNGFVVAEKCVKYATLSPSFEFQPSRKSDKSMLAQIGNNFQQSHTATHPPTKPHGSSKVVYLRSH